MNLDFLIVLIQLTDLNGKAFDVNIDTITSLHDVSESEHVRDNGNCAISTTDGKTIAVKETCDRVRELILQAQTD